MRKPLLVLIAALLPACAMEMADETDVESAALGTGGWIATCNYDHSLYDDPIVFPGMPGASHLHDFFGGKDADAFSTVTTLRAGGTTCAMRDDSSGYWVPGLYENGRSVLPTATSKHALFYYRHAGVSSGTVIQTLPDDLRMILGNARATSASQNTHLASGKITFKCGPGSGTDMPQPPTSCSSGVMTITFRFPNCWDGVHTDSADHISHVVYPTSSRCPSSHPVAIPHITGYVRYPIPTSGTTTTTLASGPYYTTHIDLWNAWSPPAMQSLVTHCINAGIDCGTNPAVP